MVSTKDEQPVYILGLSAQYHDSAACLLRDGEIIFAAHEERFTRKKHDPSFPTNAIKEALKFGKVELHDLKAIVFYEKPLLKFERLLETYLHTAPFGLKSFISAVIVWIKEKFLARRFLVKSLQSIGEFDQSVTPLLFSEHHLSHAASAFYPSPFETAAVVTLDGVGEWSSVTIGRGQGSKMEVIKELRFPHSPGLFYSAVTYYCGFRVNSGEYKLMGLAPYGNAGSPKVNQYVALIKEHLIDIASDGSFSLNQAYFSYATGLTMTNDRLWEKTFGLPRREPESELTQPYCDLALAFQLVTEELVLKIAQFTKQLTGETNLCLAGGVALNCVSNRKLQEAEIFADIWVQPAAGDAGGAMGAALAAHHLYFGKGRVAVKPDAMKGSYLGPEYTAVEIEHCLQQVGAVYTKQTETDLYKNVAAWLAKENIVGWFQGRMEWGPRALGNRSILADARSESMQKKLNLNIKFREGFRPFAPIILEERAGDYFENVKRSPYMLFVAPVVNRLRKSLPENYSSLDWRKKLYFTRSDIPAVTHLDYSARIQTVSQETNQPLHQLLTEFENITGVPVLVNTSFNVRGQPIVCTPEEAYQCFMSTDMDYLVLHSYVLRKQDQPDLPELDKVTEGID